MQVSSEGTLELFYFPTGVLLLRTQPVSDVRSRTTEDGLSMGVV